MYLFILVKSTKSYFFNIFPQGSRSNCAIWKCSTRLILVNFSFLKSTENFLQHSANLNCVAICGGFSLFWPQIDWTTGGKIEHWVVKKACQVWGCVFASAWFPPFVSAAWHIQTKHMNNHIINTTQKRNFFIFTHFHISVSSRSGVWISLFWTIRSQNPW